jgi:hypothetical protein
VDSKAMTRFINRSTFEVATRNRVDLIGQLAPTPLRSWGVPTPL